MKSLGPPLVLMDSDNQIMTVSLLFIYLYI